MTWAVVGAGYTGIAVAGEMLAAGLDVDVFDARGETGGIWGDGVYPSVRLITTREGSALSKVPMPAGDEFPTGIQMRDYLQHAASRTGVADRLRQRNVERVSKTSNGWLVDGEAYQGVVLATGMFAEPKIPDFASTLTIRNLHTATYRGPDELGDDVLIVGLGNSGADVAQECVKAGKNVTISVRRPRHIVPKRIMGMPTVEMRRPTLVPDLVARIGMDIFVRVASQYWRHGSLGQPRHLLLAETPIVHSALLPLISSGAIKIAPGIESTSGFTVTFTDGTQKRFDTVVWATGYRPNLPIDRALVDGIDQSYDSAPLNLVAGAWSPVSAGLAVAGFREPRHGRGAYLSALAQMISAGARAQEFTTEPIGAFLSEFAPASSRVLVDDDAEIRALGSAADAALSLFSASVSS
ncbi:MAG: NAD(P)/FAD-dependent oxidoreductase [Actinobacteria bacterium]|nr:NAD(P)/FAD-dependent oxidoreductase [Actinomycetota bacterium]